MGNTMMASGIINRSLLLTVAPMGASWLNALAMVVSEMGAKKSPKVACKTGTGREGYQTTNDKGDGGKSGCR